MGSRRLDVLSLAQLRKDGRRPNEIRRVKIELGCVMNDSSSTGSCLFEMGLTSVLASVMGPSECARRNEELPDRAVVSVQVRMAPFASVERRAFHSTTDRKLLEMSHLLQKVMEASILLHLYPRAKILVSLYILSDDGGRLCAAINAATCALTNAGIGLKDMVCSCSAGLIAPSSSSMAQPQQHSISNNIPLVDLNRIELQSDEDVVYLPCAIMPQRQTIVLAQCESRLNLHSYEQVLSSAILGCNSIFEIMQSAVREHSSKLLAARNGNLRVSLRTLLQQSKDVDEGEEEEEDVGALRSAFSSTL